ncbi:putative zinc finger protein [Mycena indigotica]|uniref:Putative zinc finger protein n=1 Tax=Mycena indigotica TaxID=2126181 RepID=A0A8H6SGR0_9AGAR|nr:putative zinc finger protein [Mycena indigotica]KAF7297535.1 putative zinc finger protein [Mycena indigotica]
MVTKKANLNRIHGGCDCCGKYFKTYAALASHMRGETFDFFCAKCDIDCRTRTGLRKHQSVAHAYCRFCDKYSDLENKASLVGWSHMKNTHFHCDPCREAFEDEEALHKHYIESLSTVHPYYCVPCRQIFFSAQALQDHWHRVDDDFRRDDDFRCAHCDPSPCQEAFKDEEALHEHYIESLSTVHPYYCVPCSELFDSAEALQDHLDDKLSGYAIMCPWCHQSFATRPAAVAHLESGGCVSGANLESIIDWISTHDIRSMITVQPRAVRGDYPDFKLALLDLKDPASNHDGLPCPICFTEFPSRSALEQHLKSPRHGATTFICRAPECERRFTTLSGLWAHVESMQCDAWNCEDMKTAIEQLVINLNLQQIVDHDNPHFS